MGSARTSCRSSSRGGRASSPPPPSASTRRPPRTSAPPAWRPRMPSPRHPSKVVNVVVAGLGGQGVIKASDILADVAFRAGKDVKKAEIHGMSQRGGSVTSDVRFGDEVLSPMITSGEADFLLVLAPSEVEVTRPLLRPGGLLIPPDLVDEKALPTR